jgi:hypothetical protein
MEGYSSLPLEELAKRGKLEAELNENYEQKIRALLGEENYAKYKTAEDSQAEREMADQFNRTLESGDQLHKDQEKKLANLMYSARKELMTSKGYDNLGPEV